VVFVVLHLQSGRLSLLADIVARRTLLPVKQAEPGDRPERGHVYVAPPDAHLLMAPDGTLALDRGEPVGHVRPAADVLLGSLAAVCGSRTLAVVLSGTGHDGAAGAVAVRLAGGTVIAQDRETAEFFGMPGAAIARDGVDRVLPLEGIASAVAEFVRA
jgi:two-component system chemotaxis response regulator CheB